eukprot:COSAG02_NODE_1764_length_11026_cov_4.823465_12_plen_83_part_00
MASAQQQPVPVAASRSVDERRRREDASDDTDRRCRRTARVALFIYLRAVAEIMAAAAGCSLAMQVDRHRPTVLRLEWLTAAV